MTTPPLRPGNDHVRASASKSAPLNVGFARRSAAMKGPMLLASCITALATSGVAEAQVGMTILRTESASVTVTYPTLETSKTVARGPFSLQVAVDSAPVEGNRRLVVMSHGSGGSATTDHSLAVKLVLSGFVVAQPTHRGDNSRDRTMTGPESWKVRPSEVMQAVALVAGSKTFSSLIDLTKFGVHGMSAGGVSALALAGGRWSIYSLAKHCAAYEEADLGFCALGTQDQESRHARGSLLSDLAARDIKDVPAHVSQEHGDDASSTLLGIADIQPRVASVTVMVPVAAVFTPQSLSRVSIPVGVVTAGKDALLVPEFHSAKLLRECASCKLLFNLSEAAHFDVLSPWPEVIANAAAAGYPRGGTLSPTFKPEDRLKAFDSIVSFHIDNLVNK